MRFFKGVILTLLLITTPTLLATPHEHFHMLTFHAKLHKGFKKKGRYHLIPYDHILKILDQVESGQAKKIYTKKQLKRINKFFVYLAQEGTSYQNTAAQTFLNSEKPLGTCAIWPYFGPSIYFGTYPFLNVNWKSTKKFVKKYKKEIIIGAVVVIVVATVIVATHGTGAPVVAAGLGAAHDTVPNVKEVELEPEQKEQAAQVKEYICENITLDETENKSIGEAAREAGSRLAHEVFDGISELGSVIPQAAQEIKNLSSQILPHDASSEALPIKDPEEVYKDTVAKGHDLIDQVFATNYADEYTPDAKASHLSNTFTKGELPPPGKGLPGQNVSKKIARTGNTTIRNLTLPQRKTLFSSAEKSYNKELTQAAHSFSKHARRYPEKWGILKGSSKNWHDEALNHLKEIYNGRGKFVKHVDPNTGLTWIEKRLPDGRGVRLNQDYTFKGFID